MKMHTDKECCIKLNAIDIILNRIKDHAQGQYDITSMCTSAMELTKELRCELNAKD